MPGFNTLPLIIGVVNAGPERGLFPALSSPQDRAAAVIEGMRNPHEDSGFGANVVRLGEAAVMYELGAAALIPQAAAALDSGNVGALALKTLAKEATMGWDGFSEGDYTDTGGYDGGGGDTSWAGPDPFGVDGSGLGNIGGLGSLIGGGGGMGITRTGAIGGATIAAGGLALRGLWSVLRSGGAKFTTFTINGIKGKMTDLWPAVRQYGPTAVAAALGIAGEQLATLLMNAPTHGHKKAGRGRGITGRDMKTTKRTLRTIKRMYHMLPTRRASSTRFVPYRSYRGRR